ncbi:MAG: HAD hydrolase-like protein [Polyangiaceae bacterium]
MSAPIAGIVFDLDGTLIDSRGDIAAAALHALVENGFPTLPVPTLLTYVGDGARPLLARSAGIPADDARLDAMYASFIDYYTRHPLVHTEFCAGAEAALKSLERFPLAICTNKPRVTTELVLAGLGIASAFRVVVAGNDLPRTKPDPLPDPSHCRGARGGAERARDGGRWRARRALGAQRGRAQRRRA